MSEEKISRLASVAQIGDVRLYEAKAKRSIRHAREVGDAAELTIGRGARVTRPPAKDGTFLVVAGVEARISPADPKLRPFVAVKVSFEVSYRLPEGFKASRAELDNFARMNAVFNVWPYCREFVQSMTARMGLPPVVLPLYRVGEGAKAAERRRSKPTKEGDTASPQQ